MEANINKAKLSETDIITKLHFADAIVEQMV